MSQSIFAKPINDNKIQPKNNYIKSDNDYLAPFSIDQRNEYKVYRYRRDPVKNDDLFRKSLDFLSDQINKKRNVNNINSSVARFLSANCDQELKHKIIKDQDSAYYTVFIQDSDMSFEELFSLARNLNRKAVKEDLDFTVIAGV